MSNTTLDIAGLIAEATQIRFFDRVLISGADWGSPDIARWTAEATEGQFFNRILISGTALVFYDYALTFSTEISEIWSAKLSGAQALFFLTRYSTMVYMILYCAKTLIHNPSEKLCQMISYNVMAWSIPPQIGLYGILILRTYAIYQKNQFILFVMGLTCVAKLAPTVCMELATKPEVVRSVFGFTCAQISPSSFPQFQLASVILSFSINTLVFILTCAKTIHHAIEMRRVGLGNGLGYFILRDGAMYFLFQFSFCVVGTTVFFLPASGFIGDWIGALSAISNPLTIILLMRLVLNLRRVSHGQGGNAPTLGTIGTIQEPAFAANSFLGNLGAPLRVGSEDGDDIEEIGGDVEAEDVEGLGNVDQTKAIELVPGDPPNV